MFINFFISLFLVLGFECQKPIESKVQRASASDSLQKYFNSQIGISLQYPKEWVADTTRRYFANEKGEAVLWFSLSNVKSNEEYIESNQLVVDFYTYKNNLKLSDWISKFANKDDKFLDSIISMRSAHVNHKLSRGDFKVIRNQLQIRDLVGVSIIYEDPGFLEGGKTITKTSYFKLKDKIVVLEARMKNTNLSNELSKLYDKVIDSISIAN